MAERSLRGASIGAHSLETEEGVVFAERRPHRYRCPNGHEFEISFFVEAEVPQKWECKECSAEAGLLNVVDMDDMKQYKPQRTHWDMLCERRTVAELEALLDERLEQYRSGEALFEEF